MTTPTPSAAAPAVPPGGVQQGSAAARTALVVAVILFSLVVSVIAAIESFYAFRGLAIFFGWDVSHAWMIFPLVETFLLLGSAELALRVLQRDPNLWGPRFMSYGALSATLAVNVGYRVCTLLLPMDTDGVLIIGPTNEVETWQVICLGVFAAFVPLAQMFAIHTLTNRLRRLAQDRAEARATAPAHTPAAPKIGSLLKAAAAQRITQSIEARAAHAPGTLPGTPATVVGHTPDSVPDNAEARAARVPETVPPPAEARAEEATGTRAAGTPDVPGPRAGRTATTTAARAPRTAGHAPESEADDAGTRAEAAFLQYTAHIEEHGTEPKGDMVADWLGVRNPATGRKARGDFRARYASEVTAGTRAARADLPEPIAVQVDAARGTQAADATSNLVADDVAGARGDRPARAADGAMHAADDTHKPSNVVTLPHREELVQAAAGQ